MAFLNFLTKDSNQTKKLLLILIFVILLVSIYFKRKEMSISEHQITPESEITRLTYCKRGDYYPMESRFKRALNLLLERNSVSNPRLKTTWLRFNLFPIIPCLDIQYCRSSEMINAEGWFSFMPEHANRDRLLICVSEEYQQEDDLFTAILLAHEITHAIQFVLDETNTPYGNIYNRSCFGQEAMAYTEQILFMASLTDGEGDSLISRLRVGKISSRTLNLSKLIELSGEQMNICNRKYVIASNEFYGCLVNNLASTLETMVRQNPYYQEQCSYEKQ